MAINDEPRRRHDWFPSLRTLKVLSLLCLIAFLIVAALVIARVITVFPPKNYGWYISYNVVALVFGLLWIVPLVIGAWKPSARALTFSMVAQATLVIIGMLTWIFVLVEAGDPELYYEGDPNQMEPIMEDGHLVGQEWHNKWRSYNKPWLLVGIVLYILFQCFLMLVTHRSRGEVATGLPTPVPGDDLDMS